MSLPNSRHNLNEAEKIYSKATKAEIERDFDRAFQLYIKAAEEYLHLSRSSSDNSVRETCKSEAGKALERAEKIKIVKRDLTPIVTNHFAKGEQLRILQDSSVVNGIVYPLWTPGGFASPASIDISQPPFSPVQVQNAAVWQKYSHERYIEKETEAPLLSHDIVQHVVSDCSVCASVAVCIEHNHRFNSKLVMSALHPQDAEGNPVSSENGRHYVRVLFNGAFRRVSELADINVARLLVLFLK
ncbi:hypothetical protein PHLCEN_2v11409 [Hermanssonia centrifuga]|uniref:MIT domain-containing protein n=1 Tax=Hermanssonia centrifuga TaxID=98765 RepID=A0A2R6NK02_9APHY|nr:hypothetical protein PHLCEN_2v11409 [Hermanssonia centrifuga]